VVTVTQIKEQSATTPQNRFLKTKSLEKLLKALKTNHLKENQWKKALERNTPLSLPNSSPHGQL